VWKSDSIGSDDKILTRAFVQFIIDPITKICTNIMESKDETVDKVLNALEINLTAEEKILNPKDKLRSVLKKWLNMGECLLEIII